MMESAKQLEERLLYTREYAVQDEQTNEKARVVCEDYKQFLNQGKTEREVAKVCEERLLAAGYKAFEPGRCYQPGEKIYLLHREKCVIAATIGSVDMERGFRLNAAHIDSPRLDLRPMPLFENGGMAFFRTHYYGGIRKYQWGTIPLAIHGVAYLENGRQVTFHVEGGAVFMGAGSGALFISDNYTSPTQTLENGLAHAVARVRPGASGSVTITCASEGMAAAVLTLPIK